jgi:hypothetical protein
MQDNFMQVQARPFVKLAQANVELLTRFYLSPEVTAQATASASQLFQQATESAMKLVQSAAFAHVMQGMLKNYAEFMTELGQSGMALMSQGQAALMQQAQEASRAVVDATDIRGRRAGRVA